MQEHTHSKRSRTAKLLGGALIGTVLSLGVVADSASAWKISAGSSTAAADAESSPVISFSRASGIRW